MLATRLVTIISRTARTLTVAVVLCGAALAQEATVARLDSDVLPSAPMVSTAVPESPSPHKFWDMENRLLFVAVAASSAADFAVTRANLQNGGRELNPVTRLLSGSTATLALNFAGETGGVVALSYFFHKTGHHKLERVTSMVNISASSVAAIYDVSHR